MRVKSCPLKNEKCPSIIRIPKVLYKYFNNEKEWHVDALLNSYWFFAHRSQFNDPSDFQLKWRDKNNILFPAFLNKLTTTQQDLLRSHLQPQAVLSDYIYLSLDSGMMTKVELGDLFRSLGVTNLDSSIDLFLDKIGIFCLSLKNNSSMMWSHYANGHKGFVVSYDFEKIIRRVKPLDGLKLSGQHVRYSQNQPSPLFLEETGQNANESTNASINEMLLTKYLAWAYEEEFRVIKTPPPVTLGTKNTDTIFKLKEDEIVNVIFGHKAPDEFKARLQKELPTSIKFQQAYVCHDRFDHVEIFDL